MSSLVAACYSRACAPPPTGKGGSSKGGQDLSGALKKMVSAGGKPNLVHATLGGQKVYPRIAGTARPRGAMPQVPFDQIPTFLKSLKGQGITSKNKMADPSKLVPTQTQIDARKVLALVEKIKSGKFTRERPILTARGHIIDGHHRAAAYRILGKPIEVTDIDAHPSRVMSHADKFVDSAGLAKSSFSAVTSVTHK